MGKKKMEKKAGSTPKIIYAWKTHRFENFKRHPWWHLIVFSCLVVLLGYGLFTNNYLLGIITILSGLLIYLFEKKDPQLYKFGILPEGVFAQDHVYEFSSLESFWIFYEPEGRKELSLKSKKSFMPYIGIPIGNNNPTKIKKELAKFIPEIEHEESFIDILENIV